LKLYKTLDIQKLEEFLDYESIEKCKYVINKIKNYKYLKKNLLYIFSELIKIIIVNNSIFNLCQEPINIIQAQNLSKKMGEW